MPDPILIAFGVGTLFGVMLTFIMLFVTHPGGRPGYQPTGPSGPKNPPRGGSSVRLEAKP